MAEQNNAKKSNGGVKVALKIFVGIMLIILGIWAVIAWWSSLWTLIKGFLGIFLIAVGAITIAIAKE
ncbi:MAG: hypothetical protein GF375_00635 [Candidatus Omnitrophica bacterium]|nr:hypothetical protein [Candidatus Omnitrophota bacterium]MBD3268665.1 hypothetical protein [Candidatus Omnitrophota bacterium]